ncbi:DUF1330 domain-containing protein [Thalassobaculum sp.]|jgi:uncharacterized protein (DUF1330 family)|uniref:DUF1330 domain-containing protein n=1 Tax=Thalassobaculum sp. TaxID=2022740 RepID=UPI003B5CE56B
MKPSEEEQDMAFGYVIVQVDVKDPETFEAYRAQVPATIAQYGGEYLVRGGKFEKLEGAEPLGRMVALKFPSYEQAKAWYHSEEYKGPKELRQSCSVANAILVEGVD